MKKLVMVIFISTLIVIGCIIIPSKHEINAHIQLDIRLEREAAQILDFIEGKTDELPQTVQSSDGKGTNTSKAKSFYSIFSPIGVVHAQELKSDSEKAKALALKLRERRPIIEDLKNKGYIGEDNRGYVSLLEHEDLKDAKTKNEVQQIVRDENADRKALYKEIADLNRDAQVTLSQVEKVFARAYRQRAQSGQYVQLPPTPQELEEFRNTPTGKKLGNEIKPGAWVKIP